MDPNGNITVTFDIHQWTTDGYLARVTIQNYYQYRHIDKSGWKLGWRWAKDEVIWSMRGAFATEGGNCSSFKFDIPHSCKKDPVIVDLMPEGLPENKSEDCCRGGILHAWAVNPSMSFSSFEMKVGNLGGNTTGYAPRNITFMAPGPGYTCGPVMDVAPTVTSAIGGRRQVQVFRTWKSSCTYSSFLANRTPTCCVSLSTFYNPNVTSCPLCSCGCREASEKSHTCVREGGPLPSSMIVENLDTVQCTYHMCPIQVHWHVKNNYKDYWRIKLTISNYNYNRNYTDWNVMVQHPGFNKNTTTYSFNSTVLPSVGFEDDVALFWGIKYYNDVLLQAVEDKPGSVTTEILLNKEDSFTLSNGWALPRRIYFNGEDCQMPQPDNFPALPNGSSMQRPLHCMLILFIIFLRTLVSWL
ncbi:COBRA-like protein 1 isoform X2 [Ziziphus jujuba]|nr:COBRA-like protein 1 isoform X2 [Ziziphus jujuba]XP_060667427.1 COBRA-like protein 1 isoform X2 [Ziziphus jujuba]